MRTTSRLAALLALLTAATASAQSGLAVPEASPEARVSQTVGLTRMEVSYHRPAVAGRPIWGALVPYGEVWRAGANENTTISFSSPVKIEGKPLAAGTYGVHAIPTARDWTVIFSRMSVAWGSFSYDEKEDALRVKVTPRTAPAFHERLAYAFDDPSETSVTLALRWEKLEVPVRIEVDTPAVVMASMREELRGLPRFGWQAWNQAARYWVEHGGNLDEATQMVDRSIRMNEGFANLTTRAALLEKKRDAKGAAATRARALELATEADLNQHGYQLLAQKQVDAAIAVFRSNVERHPSSWNVHDSLGEALAQKGDTAGAIASYGKALALVKDAENKARIEKVLARLRSGS
jgi:hypothetical protein